eukprot:6785828-Prorocentrum_lima.AAC.1
MPSRLQSTTALCIFWGFSYNRLSRLSEGPHASTSRSGFYLGGRAPDRSTPNTRLPATTHVNHGRGSLPTTFEDGTARRKT